MTNSEQIRGIPVQKILLLSAGEGCLPENSCLFRMDGDEFLAFLPNTPAEDAEKLIERMQQTASSYAIKEVTLSVSLGYCTMEDANDSIADSIKRSDADMYRDKQRKKAARVE